MKGAITFPPADHNVMLAEIREQLLRSLDHDAPQNPAVEIAKLMGPGAEIAPATSATRGGVDQAAKRRIWEQIFLA